MNPVRIYTHDQAANIVELFESVLDRHDIQVPSPKDDERGPNNAAKLYDGEFFGMEFDVAGITSEELVKFSWKF